MTAEVLAADTPKDKVGTAPADVTVLDTPKVNEAVVAVVVVAAVRPKLNEGVEAAAVEGVLVMGGISPGVVVLVVPRFNEIFPPVAVAVPKFSVGADVLLDPKFNVGADVLVVPKFNAGADVLGARVPNVNPEDAAGAAVVDATPKPEPKLKFCCCVPNTPALVPAPKVGVPKFKPVEAVVAVVVGRVNPFPEGSGGLENKIIYSKVQSLQWSSHIITIKVKVLKNTNNNYLFG